MPTTSPPSCSTSRTFAADVPPVASRSSWIEHARARADRVLVQLQARLAVLERVLDADRPPRQLPRLARGDEPCAELVSERPAEDEPPRLRAEDELRRARSCPLGELVDRRPERGRVGEQRHDVLEEDPRLREVRDVPDVRLQIRHLRGELAQVAHEEELRQLLREAGEGAEILERGLAPLRRPGAQRRRDELLDERGLAVGGVAEGAQMARADAEADEARADERNLRVGLDVAPLAGDRPRRDEPVLLELAGELRRDPAALAAARPRSSSCSSSPASASGRRRVRSAEPGAASSWRMTRSGRNSSRCMRRIARSRSSSSSPKSR